MSFVSTLKKLFLTLTAKSTKMITSNEGKNAMEKTKNYTEAQEARMAEFAVIDNDTAVELAAEFGKDVRSVRAKAVRMGLYKAKEKVSKTGGKIESKEDIVAEISELVGKNLEGLEKASKQALIVIRDRLAAA